ncbi:MAG TPA: DMT family transporter [Bellilinea sp.]|nr:DMT family transporter [Bellilinea sp.]
MSLSTERSNRYFLFAILGMFIWSGSATLIRYLSLNYDITPLQTAEFRMIMSGLIILIVLVLLRPKELRLDASQWKLVIVYGILLAIFDACWTLSVYLNGAAVGTVLVYTSAAFTAIFAIYLFHEPMTLIKAVVVVMSLAGCVLVANAHLPSAWVSNALGIITGLVSGLLFSIYSVFGKVASQRKIPPWTVTSYTFLISAVPLALINQFIPYLGEFRMGSGTMFPPIDLSGWLVILALAAGPTVLGYGTYVFSLGKLPASVMNIVATTEPIFTAMQSFVWLGERYTLVQIVGSLLIISGVLILQFFDRPKTPAPEPQPAQ